MNPRNPERERRPPTALRLVYAVVTFTSLLAIELLARGYLSWRDFSSTEFVFVPGAQRGGPVAALDASALDTLALVPDADLLWRNRPDMERTMPVIPSTLGQAAVWTLRTNSEGFRGPERRTNLTSEEVYRILCIGDSVTQGFNVDQGKDYPAVLERLLAERYPKGSFEVINAGVAEWTWVQGAAFLIREGFALHPDLVVAAHGTADQLRPTSVTDSERIWLGEHPAVRSGESFRRFAERSGAWRLFNGWRTTPTDRAGRSSQSPGCRLQEEAGVDCRRDSVAEIRATVGRMGAATKGAGVDLLLMNLDFSATAAAAAVHQAAIRDDLRFLDPVSHMTAESLVSRVVQAEFLGLAAPLLPFVPFGGIGPLEGRGPTVLFRVSALGNFSDLRVRGGAPEDDGFRFDQQLRDDGTSGDEKAGDKVFSAVVETLPWTTVLQYRFYADGRPEFTLPSMVNESNSDRTIRFNRDSITAVESFGVRRLMSDDLHPDAEGQALIAGYVLAGVEEVASFRHFAGLPKHDGASPQPGSPPSVPPLAPGVGKGGDR